MFSRACVASRVCVRVSSVRRDGVGLPKVVLGIWSARRPAPVAPASWFVISWTASVEPALFGPPQLSLLQEHSTAVIRVLTNCGGSDLSLSSRQGLSSGWFVCRYVYLLPVSLSTDPPSTRTQRSHISGSGLPEPMTQSEQQGFSLALTRLLAMTANDNNSIHAHTLI